MAMKDGDRPGQRQIGRERFHLRVSFSTQFGLRCWSITIEVGEPKFNRELNTCKSSKVDTSP